MSVSAAIRDREQRLNTARQVDATTLERTCGEYVVPSIVSKSMLTPLTPSERVNVIREIARRLGGEDWAVIDLTLRQFGLPTQDRWTGTSENYIMTMLEDQSSADLVGLADHLGYQQDRRSQLQPAFWEVDYLRLFLSHLATHKADATELKAALAPFGISAFVAHRDIEPTKEWQTEIEVALNTCDALVAMLHPSFHASNWTDQEIGFAMGRQTLIISIRYGQDPYGFIGRYQAMNGAGHNAKELAQHLFEILIANKQTASAMSRGLVAAFERSGRYKEAIERSQRLELVSDWPPMLLARVKEALDGNDQISGAFGVPNRVKQLLERHGAA